MNELHQRAAKFIQVEEYIEFKSQARIEENQGKRNDRDHNPPRLTE